MPGRSLTQCRESEDRHAEKDCGANGRGVGAEGSVSREWDGRRSLKGREASRWRRAGAVSAEVRWPRRVERGGEVGSGGCVRDRAMLHALAPRSRTVGKCRLISCERFSQLTNSDVGK